MVMKYIRKPVIMARVSRPAITSRPPYHMTAAMEPKPRNIISDPKAELYTAIRSESWKVFSIGAVVTLRFVLLAPEALDHPDALQPFLGHHRRSRQLVLDPRAAFLDAAAKQETHQQQHRHQRQDEQRQAGVQRQHDHDRADQRHRLAEQRGEIIGQHGAHLGHVAGQARDDIPHPPVGVKVKRQALQMVIQGSAQVVHDVLADISQQVGLQERESRLQQEDAAQQNGQVVERGQTF